MAKPQRRFTFHVALQNPPLKPPFSAKKRRFPCFITSRYMQLFKHQESVLVRSNWRFPEMRYPQIIHFNKIFHYKPSSYWVAPFMETFKWNPLHASSVWYWTHIYIYEGLPGLSSRKVWGYKRRSQRTKRHPCSAEKKELQLQNTGRWNAWLTCKRYRCLNK